VIILKGDLELAAKYTDPHIHQYAGQANDWLYREFGKEVREAYHDENIVDVIKKILALGISIGDASVGYGWDQL
jgi:hypothetical protein